MSDGKSNETAQTHRSLDGLVRPCVTHNNACDCREALMLELLKDVMQIHADPKDPNYNGCDTDPCQWCEDALKLIGPNKVIGETDGR